MRIKLLATPVPVGVSLPWFAWRPVFIGGYLVWRENIYRTRWHSPMGYWYWDYSYAQR